MYLSLAVIVLTKNEETDLPRCLNSINRITADLHVVDSGSTDRTQAIAKNLGAKVYVNPFQSFGLQRNWALDHCELKSPWVLFLDADEEATPDFLQEIKSVLERCDDTTVGFYCCWKMILNGQWLKRSDSFPKWQLRIVRRGKVSFIDFGHGQKEGDVPGVLEYIRAPYNHYAFSKGWRHWVDRHNRYSDLEAVERLRSRLQWKNLFSRHGSKRNPEIKLLLSNTPGWPLIRFLYTYFLRLGFMDGIAGFRYAVMLMFYETMIIFKMEEIKTAKRTSSPS